MPSEKEKMLAGEYYDASDAELTSERLHARNLMFLLNQFDPSLNDKKQELLRKLIRPRGTINIEPPFYCDYGYNIEVGDNFFANYGCTILDVTKVSIGKNVMFGPHVQIYTATHPLDPQIRASGKEYGLPITIGNDVWIGGGCVICPGIRIGNNVTIGAGSVVTKDIPDNAVAVGNPCKVIKFI